MLASLAGGVNAGSVEVVMVVSCEPVFEWGWLCVEPSSRSTEGLLCILAIAAATTAWAVVVLTIGVIAAPSAGAAAVGVIDAIGWEARESASAGGSTARSPPCRAPVVVSVVASGRGSAVLNGGGGAIRLLLSTISPRGRFGVMSVTRNLPGKIWESCEGEVKSLEGPQLERFQNV